MVTPWHFRGFKGLRKCQPQLLRWSITASNITWLHFIYDAIQECNSFSARCVAFVERIVALLPWCSLVRLSGAGVHCDHTVHFSADLSLRLDSPKFRAPWHQSMSTYSQPSCSSSSPCQSTDKSWPTMSADNIARQKLVVWHIKLANICVGQLVFAEIDVQI